MLKSLDSVDTSRLFDSEANPTLALHLQARHSLDESSSDLESGFHNSWRLSTWSKRIHGATLFTIDEEKGSIEVPSDGLYIVYAQVSVTRMFIVKIAKFLLVFRKPANFVFEILLHYEIFGFLKKCVYLLNKKLLAVTNRHAPALFIWKIGLETRQIGENLSVLATRASKTFVNIFQERCSFIN